MVFNSVGCCWVLLDVMLLSVFGCCWMLLAVDGCAGCCWMLAVECCWMLDVVGLLLGVVEYC